MTPELYYLDRAGQAQGPYAPRQLNDLRKAGKIAWDTPVAEAGADEWASLATYADLVEPGKRAGVAEPGAVFAGPHAGIQAAGAGLQVLGAAVTLVNPIVGVGMMVAGSRVKKAGEA